MNLWNDKVMRSMFAFALGVVFVVLQFVTGDNNPNKILVALGVIWCIAALYWTIMEVKNDWNAE